MALQNATVLFGLGICCVLLSVMILSSQDGKFADESIALAEIANDRAVNLHSESELQTFGSLLSEALAAPESLVINKGNKFSKGGGKSLDKKRKKKSKKKTQAPKAQPKVVKGQAPKKAKAKKPKSAKPKSSRNIPIVQYSVFGSQDSVYSSDATERPEQIVVEDWTNVDSALKDLSKCPC